MFVDNIKDMIVSSTLVEIGHQDVMQAIQTKQASVCFIGNSRYDDNNKAIIQMAIE